MIPVESILNLVALFLVAVATWWSGRLTVPEKERDAQYTLDEFN